jgi:4-carboxymuconolactone decarboxylase
MAKLAEQRGEALGELQFEPWTDPVDDEARRTRGERSYREVQGAEPPAGNTAFRGAAYLDYLYGEIWTRGRYLTRRDRRIVSICCCGAVGVDEEAREHVRAALVQGDMSYEELQELVVHFAVYVGWALGRRLDDLLVDVASSVGAA